MPTVSILDSNPIVLKANLRHSLFKIQNRWPFYLKTDRRSGNFVFYGELRPMRLPGEFMLVAGFVKSFKITALVHFPAVFIGIEAAGFFLKQSELKRVDIPYQNGRPQTVKPIKSNVHPLVPDA